MDAETTFRATLVDQLTSLVNSKELDERLVRMDHVEDKQDVLGEFLDYYTEELLRYPPFSEGFTPLEVERLRSFLYALDSASREKTNWGSIRGEAGRLLAKLAHDPALPQARK